MRKKYVAVGVKGDFCPKYDDGRCRICVWVLQGEPETVRLAEKCRRKILRQEAKRLYFEYSLCSYAELDELFRYYNVSCLSELVETRLRQNLFLLLAYPYAETVLSACDTQFAAMSFYKLPARSRGLYEKAG